MLNKLMLVVSTGLMLTNALAAPPKVNPKSKERKLYVGSNSTEATFEFSSTVEIETTRAPQEKTLRKFIESQLEHMIGPMSMMQYTAVPKGDHVVSNVKVISKTATTVIAGYTFKGTAVLQNGAGATYPIYLPINPAKIYSTSMVGNKNPCTDDHYQSEGDFWYFWSPDREGCTLKEGKDYRIVSAKVKRFTNTAISYPEYQNLPDEKGNITIHVLFGMDDPSLNRNPLKSEDINAVNYRKFRSYLVKNGYKTTTWSDEKVKAIAKTLDGDAPFVETIQKDKIIYRFMYAPTGINEDSMGFHWFYKDALENASIMMYEGHSGLGGHLDLDSIEASLGTKISLNTKRYQIYFFDSCTSYKYYNNAYFERKKTSQDPKGSKKLDIFTNGLATTFDSMTASSTAIAIAVEKSLTYATTGTNFISYQTLAKQIDSNNLFGINGDEDNATPKQIK